MFRLYHSNDLDVLKELLVHQMQQGDSDPFIAEQILVQSQGMAHWLKLQIAESLGIAANIEFPLPSSFVWKVYNSVKPDLPERSHFEKESMTWKLMSILPGLLDEALFAPIAHYLNSGNGSSKEGLNQQKVFALAEKIADTFDQYLVYRPDWLLAWEAGEDEIKDGDVSSQPWQPELWRRLVQASDELGHSLFHRARLTDQLVDIVRCGKDGLKDLLPASSGAHNSRIFVFGIAALPGTYWQVLNAISEHVDVHFFLLNPCRNYWGDIVNEKTRAKLLQKDVNLAQYFSVGNPLLASWGKLGRDFITLTHEAANETGRETLFQDIDAFVDIESNQVDGNKPERNLLKNIQYDFLELKDRSIAAYGLQGLENSHEKLVVEKSDQSLQIISAHSPLREVQTLFDQMLSWFDQDAKSALTNKEALRPRDILVMVPDIDIYAPYIEAVFGSAKDDLRIPWAIADQALNKENLVIDSFLRLLQLPSSRLTINDVIELLEVPAIAQQFDIALEDLEQVKAWLMKANIRWGLDESHRSDLGLPSWDDNSWFKGLQQLLLGLVMPDCGHNIDLYWPVSGVMGSQGELLGKVMAFVDQLSHWYQILKDATETAANQASSKQAFNSQALMPLEWQQLLLDLISDFYPSQSTDEQGLKDQLVLQKIRDQIQRWQQELKLAAFEEGLSHGVVLQYLTACLTKQVGWQRFLAGPVNFCTLMPMRSIPFKIVCMLGMNDEDYPRRVPPQGFDLMAQGGYRRGDRSRREDDRYLFLEAVSAAQEKLYISYRGRDSRENNEMQPCVLVSELIDYIANGYVLQGDRDLPHNQSEKNLRQHLIDEQLLQPFNAEYFLKNGKQLQSYHSLWQQVAQAGCAVEHSFKEENPVDEALPPGNFIVNSLADDRDSNIRFSPELDDLKSCLSNPAKFFIQRRLKVNLTQYWQESEVDEPFALDSLQTYLLNEAIIETELSGNTESFKSQQKSLGYLPPAGFSNYILAQSEAKIAPLIETIKNQYFTLHDGETDSCYENSAGNNTEEVRQNAKQATHTSSIIIGEYQLSGQLEHLIQRNGISQVFHFRSGGFNPKQIMNLWMEHLFVCACEQLNKNSRIGNSIGLGIDKDGELEQCEFVTIKQELAQQYLADLIEFMNSAYCLPQPFFLQLGWNYLCAGTDKADDVLTKASANEFSELNDEFVWRCFSASIETDEIEFLSAQIPLWQHILQPMLDHKVEAKTEEE